MKTVFELFDEWDLTTIEESPYYRGTMCAFAEWYHQKREQERQEPAPNRDDIQGPPPDRDELAMSMPVEHLPQLKDTETFAKVCEKLGIECDPADPESYIKASLEYDARVRYMYADAMLKARKV